MGKLKTIQRGGGVVGNVVSSPCPECKGKGKIGTYQCFMCNEGRRGGVVDEFKGSKIRTCEAREQG